MRCVGIDVGSRTIKLVLLDGNTNGATTFRKEETIYNPIEQCRRILNGIEPSCLVATGYGRKLAQENFGGEVISEIPAHALGAALFAAGR